MFEALRRWGRRAVRTQQLSKRNRLLESALNNMSQGLCMFDAAERLIVCNERYLQIYGLSPEHARPGRTLRELLELRRRAGSFSGHPERYCAELRSVIALGRTTNRAVELPDGRTISLVNQPMAGGGWVATHLDMTERRRAEKELDRTRSFLHMVIENIPAMVFVKEPREHRFVLVNRAGETLLGVSRDQLIGKSAHYFFPPHESERFEGHDRAVLQAGELQVALDEHPISTPHNGIRLVTSKRLPIMGEDGKPEYLLGVVEDVTERRRAEERIAHLAHHDPLTDLPNRAALPSASPSPSTWRGHRASSSPCCASISTASSRLMTCLVTRPAMPCCARCRAACRPPPRARS